MRVYRSQDLAPHPGQQAETCRVSGGPAEGGEAYTFGGFDVSGGDEVAAGDEQLLRQIDLNRADSFARRTE